MSDLFESWAVVELGKPFQKWSYKPKTRGTHDVDIKIICCGICASDVHQVESGWGQSIYPIVPGHEIIGIVVGRGKDVTRFKDGDRVGVGPQVLSCFSCEECRNHDESYCKKTVFTYNSKYENGDIAYGGYAKNIRLHENFAVLIPDNLDSFKAAPLLCAGVTVYDPLIRYNIRGKKLAVLGVGGLGHMGIKFGVALGNEVVGISRGENKREDTLKLGANDYIASSDPEQLKKYNNYFDFMLCTINEPTGDDWIKYMNLIKSHGTLCLLGIPNEPLMMNVKGCIFTNKHVTGTVIGSPSRIEEMLQFCSKNNIVSDVQVYPISKVNEAYDDFRQGKPRWRFVLQIEQ